MRYLAWVIMAVVFLGTFALTQDLLMSFGAQLFSVFLMVLFGKQYFFGVQNNPDLKKEEDEK